MILCWRARKPKHVHGSRHRHEAGSPPPPPLRGMGEALHCTCYLLTSNRSGRPFDLLIEPIRSLLSHPGFQGRASREIMISEIKVSPGDSLWNFVSGVRGLQVLGGYVLG